MLRVTHGLAWSAPGVWCTAGGAARVLADAILQQAAEAAPGAAEGGGEEEGGGEQGGGGAAAARGVLLRLLRSLDLRYPAALDAAVDAALRAAAGGGAGPAASTGAADDTAGDQQQGQPAGEAERRRRQLLGVLGEAFDGTARGPLAEAGTTVLLAAEAPSAAVRQMVRACRRARPPPLAC